MVCLGILVADVVGKPVDHFPERGKLILVDRMELHVGGCASNTALALAKIGVNCSVVGKVGNDGFGDFIEKTLKTHGVDTSGLRRDPSAATSSTMVLVHSDGERSFIHYIGANATLREEEIPYDLIFSSKILNIGGFFLMPGFDGEPLARVLKRVKENRGPMVVLDTAWDSRGRWMSLLEPCLPYVDYFLPSYEEARMLTGKNQPEEIAQFLLQYGIPTVAIKLGEQGAYVATHQGQQFYLPAFKVKAVDAVGAGDCWVAGFLTGILKEWPLEETVRFANATGALCVTAIGATTGVGSFEEIQNFIATHRS